MVSNADSIGTDVNSQTLAGFADRWIYVFMAALFVVAALTGFIPDSLRLLAAVESGQRPPLPPILHAHALVMGSWLLLFLVQTTLVATDRTAQHRRLGLVGAVLAVAVVLVTIGLVRTRWAQVLPPDVLSRIETARSGILMEQIRELVLFSIFVSWALLVRRTDSETHRRLMLFATLLPLPAALDRINWIPTTLPEGPASVHIGMLALLLPVFGLRRVAPRAYSSRLRDWPGTQRAVHGGIAFALGLVVVGGRRTQADGQLGEPRTA